MTAQPMGDAAFSSETAARPLITVVICTLNEERYIGNVIDDVLAQQGLDADVEILVLDGGSTDRTKSVVRSYAGTHAVRLIHNPRKHQVFAYNIALREARGDIFCIVHGHARYSPDYLAACLRVRRKTGAANVGGVVRHEGEGIAGRAIALAMSSPIGVGDSHYRHSKVERYADSVMGSFVETKLAIQLGGFNESNIVNQDGEFNYRLRASGHGVYLSPSIRCTYFVRPSLVKLFAQYRRYGYYRRWTEVQHPGSVPWRVYVPPLFVLGLACSISFAAGGEIGLGLIVPGAYVCVLVFAAAAAVVRSGSVPVALVTPLALAAMHVAFGIGWIHGLLVHRRRASKTTV
jgi:succinoglycan biosynthesis protein ExoA